jgi:hypothetical protein
MHAPFIRRQSRAQVVWHLHHGRFRRPLVSIVSESNSPLFRVMWPDAAPSAPANLTRCKAAGLEWAERYALADH